MTGKVITDQNLSSADFNRFLKKSPNASRSSISKSTVRNLSLEPLDSYSTKADFRGLKSAFVIKNTSRRFVKIKMNKEDFVSKEIEEKFKKILNQLSERELKNRALAKKTLKVKTAIEYLKAVTKNKKGA